MGTTFGFSPGCDRYFCHSLGNTFCLVVDAKLKGEITNASPAATNIIPMIHATNSALLGVASLQRLASHVILFSLVDAKRDGKGNSGLKYVCAKG